MNKSITLLGVNSMLKKLLAFVCLTLSLSVSAAPTQYTVTGPITGTFTFDPTTNAYSDVSLLSNSFASTPLGQSIWTLSGLSVIGSTFAVAIDYAGVDSLSLRETSSLQATLDLAFDPFLSQSAPSQVSWSETFAPPAETISGTSVATPVPPPTPVLSFPVAIIDGSNSYSTTVDGITMTIDNPAPNSLSSSEGYLDFGDVSALAFLPLLSFDVSFDSRVWLTSLDHVYSIGTVTFSIVGNGVASYGNTIDGALVPPAPLPFVGGPLQLQPGDRYTFSAVTGGSGLDAMAIGGFNTVGAPACTQEDYVLLTQAEVDAFPQDCDSVRRIIVGFPSSPQGPSGPSDIANLDGLSGLTSVESDFIIWVNNDLTTLAGLDNLNSVGGFFIVEYNSALVNLDGLSGLTSVGRTLQIASNANLINLDDLRNLISVGDGLMLENNDALNNCQGVAPLLGWPSGPANVGNFIQIFSNGSDCNSVEAILASVSGPSQPVISAATGRNESISLAFPLSTTPDALFPITGYEAVCAGLTETETAAGVSSPISVSNLTNYREYDCTVAPVTGLGVLPLSSPVSAFAGAVPPSAPQITSIDPGNEEVFINFNVADDGGSAITSYDAYCGKDGNIYLGSSLTSPITVSGLTNSVTYVCLVTATNDVGTSPVSAVSAPVTPEGPADTDGDGVPDLTDNCVSIPNADQEPSFVPGCGAACVTSSCAGTICVNR